MTEDEKVGWHHRCNGHGFGPPLPFVAYLIFRPHSHFVSATWEFFGYSLCRFSINWAFQINTVQPHRVLFSDTVYTAFKSVFPTYLIMAFIQVKDISSEQMGVPRALGTLDATHKVPRNPGLPREEH